MIIGAGNIFRTPCTYSVYVIGAKIRIIPDYEGVGALFIYAATHLLSEQTSQTDNNGLEPCVLTLAFRLRYMVLL